MHVLRDRDPSCSPRDAYHFFDFLFGQLALDQETDLVGFEPLLCVPSIAVPRRNDWHRKMSAHLAQCNLIGFMWVYFHPLQVSCTRSAAFHVLPSVHLSLPPLGDCWAPAEGLLGGSWGTAGGCSGTIGELLEGCCRGSAEGPRNGRWIDEKVEDGRWKMDEGGVLGGCLVLPFSNLPDNVVCYQYRLALT